ncbi:DNA-binding response regulator, OmpR family, contains REC and winged-helix (wHTH) domain [Clostridium collagenovorans DSM 3089]|uniref:Stage 0 sporulation protein A homolog n=1 Tax=Clostridium collagenovorans DSM 3089 TaxID=1121306 RepID=A0A1M5S9H5_9CLOT|nr:DNA-binding response regulator, OmpR family, contains REC and winged-helix (wHTH) domain [Clostridium collagenovorans DSM 3089]
MGEKVSNILVIDDEEDICKLIKNALSNQKYIIETRNNAIDISVDELKKFDLILMDVMMPKIDGFTLCKRIREEIDCPIIFITAKILEEDIIEGFSIGGDDYIKKPFSILELRARVAAHLRRENREHHNTLSTNGLRFDLQAKELFFNDIKISLTKGEYNICELLAKHKGQVFSLEQIFVKTYGYDKNSDNSAIREHIKNIRAKINLYIDNPIETVWGVGYKWI